MAFKKGETGNPGGRPAGAKGRTPAQIQQIFIQFLSKNIDEMQKCFEQLKPVEKLEIIYKFGKLILPKAVEIDDRRPVQPILKIEVTRPEYADELRKLIDSIENEPEPFTALPQAQTEQPAQTIESKDLEQPQPRQEAHTAPIPRQREFNDFFRDRRQVSRTGRF